MDLRRSIHRRISDRRDIATTLRRILQRLIRLIDQLNETVGRGVAWLTTALVLVIGFDVAARYLFNTSSPGVVELEWHLFSFIFLLGAAYALKHDRHVRVDVFYQKFTAKQQAWVNLVGTLLFLLPFCYVIVVESWQFTYNAWSMHEGFTRPRGLARPLHRESGHSHRFLAALATGAVVVIHLAAHAHRRCLKPWPSFCFCRSSC